MKVRVFALWAAILGSVFSAAGQVAGSGQTSANVLGHGYRAFVEVGGMSPSTLTDLCILDISTTHGYQFNPHFFAGIGFGAVALIGGTGTYKFLDLRYDASEGEPRGLFFGMRAMNIDDGFLVQPRIGYRLGRTNFSAGCWLDGSSDPLFSIGIGWDFGGRKKSQ